MKRTILDFDGKVTTWQQVAKDKGYSVGYVKRRFRGHYMSVATLRGQGKPNAIINTGLWLRLEASISTIVYKTDQVRFNVRKIGVFGVYVNPVSGVRNIQLIVLELNGKNLQAHEDFYPLEIVLERNDEQS